MAQYFEDWSGSTLGSEPTGWTKRWNSNQVAYVVQADADAPAGRRLRITPSVNARRGLSWDIINADPNISATLKIRALMRIGADGATSATSYAGPYLRGDGAAVETGYVGLFSRIGPGASDRSVRVGKYVSGTFTEMYSSATPAWDAGVLYWMGLENDGANVRLTVAHGDDPDTIIYDQTIADSSIVTSNANRTGIFSNSASASYVDILAVGVGTNGDEAPVIGGGASPSTRGVSEQIGDGAPAANQTGLTVCWWDASTPDLFGAPTHVATGVTTNASGVLQLDLESVTSLAVGAWGFMLVYKGAELVSDDLIAGGRVQIKDVA